MRGASCLCKLKEWQIARLRKLLRGISCSAAGQEPIRTEKKETQQGLRSENREGGSMRNSLHLSKRCRGCYKIESF
ncbi:hypothetical protein TrCOL_g8667 [Triparma columacea]|uniref:Uncharacterized protein n=1 Tax=Triparma columacea TaxID=722753 RepID=A0A9W7L2T8_9STRA|nr:hypothetical protein TrCOL_g8667 [Triparma columacea]